MGVGGFGWVHGWVWVGERVCMSVCGRVCAGKGMCAGVCV